MSEYNVLDLFAGLGGFSQAFEDSDRWDVTTVDIEPEYEPDIVADVFELRPSDFEKDFDVVLASPPCTDFSPVAWSHGMRFDTDGVPLTESARESVALVYHTLGLIRAISPDYWWMENPRGALRWVIGEPKATVDYCQFGHYTKKPTDMWGNHAPMEYPRCDHESHTGEDGVTDFELGPSKPSERAVIPEELSIAILEAVEAALDGTAPEQAQVADYV